MAVFIDDQAVEVAGRSLGEVLQSAGRHLEGSGRTVVEVQVGPDVLDSAGIEAQLDAPLDAADVRLYTADPHDLAVTTLRQVQKALAHAGELQAQAADQLQQDNLEAAMHEVAEALRIWQQAGQAVLQAAQLVGIRLDDYQFQDQPVAVLVQELIEQLKALSQLITDKDTLGLADALAYEWPETTDRWTALIDHLIEWIEQQSGA